MDTGKIQTTAWVAAARLMMEEEKGSGAARPATFYPERKGWVDFSKDGVMLLGSFAEAGAEPSERGDLWRQMGRLTAELSGIGSEPDHRKRSAYEAELKDDAMDCGVHAEDFMEGFREGRNGAKAASIAQEGALAVMRALGAIRSVVEKSPQAGVPGMLEWIGRAKAGVEEKELRGGLEETSIKVSSPRV